ncbi:MAG: alkaline phosphatase PhoX [Phycisphaerae bacterium]
MSISRRAFVRSAVAVTLGFRGLRELFAAPLAASLFDDPRMAAGFGPLEPDRERILDLPAGFAYKIIARAGDRMDDGFFLPGQPDGMAAFAGPNGRTILVRNHELEATDAKKGPFGRKNELLERVPKHLAYDRGREKHPCQGAVTKLLFDTADQRVERQYLALACTQYNCAGGPTPWGSWITCEESTQRADERFEQDHGYPFEVPATFDGKLIKPTPIKAMGRFRREAVAVEPTTGIVYQTEDIADGLFYRYLPNKRGELLAGGHVQALCVGDRESCDTRNWVRHDGKPIRPFVPRGVPLAVRWLDLEEVDAPNDDLRHRGFCAGAACFARAEGIWYGRDSAYFACTEGGPDRKGQIWRYTPSPHEGTSRERETPGLLELFVEANDSTLLDNADNLTIAPWGDLIACEDGPGEQFLLGVTPAGTIYKLARGADGGSEFAGATFSPDATTLFVNIQGAGLTLAITGPWGAART